MAEEGDEEREENLRGKGNAKPTRKRFFNGFFYVYKKLEKHRGSRDEDTCS